MCDRSVDGRHTAMLQLGVPGLLFDVEQVSKRNNNGQKSEHTRGYEEHRVVAEASVEAAFGHVRRERAVVRMPVMREDFVGHLRNVLF